MTKQDLERMFPEKKIARVSRLKEEKKKIEHCIEKIAELKKEFGATIVYKASRRYYDRAYSQYDFVE